jgi:hypothetical protein
MIYIVVVNQKDPMANFVGPFPNQRVAAKYMDNRWGAWDDDTEVVKLESPTLPRKKRRRKNGHSHWTAKQERLLAKHYPRCSYKTLGRLLGRSPAAVAMRASQLGLTK